MQAHSVTLCERSRNLDQKTATAEHKNNGDKIAVTNIPQSSSRQPLGEYAQRNGRRRHPSWRPNTVQHVDDDAPPPTTGQKILGSVRRRGIAFQVRRRLGNLQQVCGNDDCDRKQGELDDGKAVASALIAQLTCG